MLSHLLLLALAAPTATPPAAEGQVVVANRASGSISVIDVASDTVTATIDLPSAANAPEPMYVEPAGDLLFVGDRGNDRVVAYDPADWSLAGTVPAGAGVFHMKADLSDRDLWVVDDIDNTVSVIDTAALLNVGTVVVPADLVAAGGKPHDVVVDQRFGYVAVNGVSGPDDFVVQFSRKTLLEVQRIAVGDDAHFGIDRRNRNVFVPSQGADSVHVLRRFFLDPVDVLDVPGAHGAWMARNGSIFYTTNLPGGGTDGLVTIDARKLTVLGTTDTPYDTPHNVAVDSTGLKVYVSHSGATADKVTIYTTTRTDPVPVLAGELTVGLNPFGITYLP